MSQGFMTVAELATYRVPEDVASPCRQGDTWWLVRCSMSGCSVFYERVFSIMA
jgi:hypothetical protein